MCFQPFVLLVLCVASSISRRQRTCVKGVGKDCKGEKEPICFQAGKVEAQASSLIQAESLIALESARLEERERSLPLIFLGTTSLLTSLVETLSSSSKGSEVLRLRWSGEAVMLHWAWLLVSWVWMCTPWLIIFGKSGYHVELHGFVVGLVRMCLVSGRVQIASRSVAGQCEPNACGVVHLLLLALLLGMTTKGKVPKAPWVVLLRKDPALCRPRPALDHMLCRLVGRRPGPAWGIPLTPLLWMLTSPLRIWSRHSSISKMS